MLRSAGARRLRKTLIRYPAGAKIAQRIASWTWELELIQTQMAQKPMLRAEVPGPRGISPGYLLPQQGIASMVFSGVGRQPISASPVLFLASEVRITWL